MPVGDVYRVRRWDHNQGTEKNHTTFSFSFPRKGPKKVAVMMLLGEEPFDESKPGLDLEAVMNNLGWYRKDV